MTPSPANPGSAGRKLAHDFMGQMIGIHTEKRLAEAIESAIQQAVAGALAQKFANVKKVILDLSWIPLNMRHDVIRNLETYTSVPADAQAALDALIETAIERCCEAVEEAYRRNVSDENWKSRAVNSIRNTVTPASVKAEHALRERQGKKDGNDV